MKAMEKDKLFELLEKNDDLRFILMTEEEFNKENLDFYVYTCVMSLEQVRAMYYRLSPRMKYEYLELLEIRIDELSNKPEKQPTKPKVIMHPKPWGQINYSELFTRRRKRE